MSGRWVEGVVTSVLSGRVFITFNQGSTIYRRAGLSLGDVVDIRVKQAKGVDCFDIIDMGNDIRRRDDLTIEPYETTKCTVYCTAEVIERRNGYFLLDTPIIGLAVFPTKDAPQGMEVGDVWRVKMLRKKDKNRTPSFWWIMAVDGKRPRLSTELSRRKEKEEKERMDRETVDQSNTSGYSSFDSLPSTPNSSQDVWTTVFITRSNNLFWFGCCAQPDVIRISIEKFKRYVKNLVIGYFYRMKLSRERNGDVRVNDIDRDPVYPKDIEVDTTKNIIQLWCYSEIVEERHSSFIVHNSLIGNAILPLNNVTNKMRVGDRLETLYRLEKERTPDNATNWMVIDAVLDRTKKEYDDKKEEVIIQRVDECKEVQPLKEEKSAKDGRVVDKMHHLMSFPIVKRTFAKEDPKSLEMIERILNKV